jgi:hypothetical protein
MFFLPALRTIKFFSLLGIGSIVFLSRLWFGTLLYASVSDASHNLILRGTTNTHWQISLMSFYKGTGPSLEIEGSSLQAETLPSVSFLAGGNSCSRWIFEVPFGTSITYKINEMPYTISIPQKDSVPHILYTSCSDQRNDTTAENWRKIEAQHVQAPYHIWVGGGDQVYADDAFGLERGVVPQFFWDLYLKWMSFTPTLCTTCPALYQLGDHEIRDGYGSYATPSTEFQRYVESIAIEVYLLFQHHTTSAEQKEHIGYLLPSSGYSKLYQLGAVAIAALDTRLERTPNAICSPGTWGSFWQAIKALPSSCKTLFVAVEIPPIFCELGKNSEDIVKEIASQYVKPDRRVFREAMKKFGLVDPYGNFDAIDEVIDRWGGLNHKQEHDAMLVQLQEIARIQKLQVVFLSGDVHMAGVLRLQSSNPDRGDIIQFVSSGVSSKADPVVARLTSGPLSMPTTEAGDKFVLCQWPQSNRNFVTECNWMEIGGSAGISAVTLHTVTQKVFTYPLSKEDKDKESKCCIVS